jgi:hypothetical protein
VTAQIKPARKNLVPMLIGPSGFSTSLSFTRVDVNKFLSQHIAPEQSSRRRSSSSQVSLIVGRVRDYMWTATNKLLA